MAYGIGRKAFGVTLFVVVVGLSVALASCGSPPEPISLPLIDLFDMWPR